MKPTLLFLLLQLLFLLQNCKSAGSGNSQTAVNSADITFQKNEEGINLAYYQNKPFTGIIFTLHPNGNRFVEKSFIKGLEEGQWTIWYPDGTKMKTGHIENGLKNGPVTEWWENGKLKYVQPYVNGKKNGKWESWYDTGVKWTERDFENDMLNGKVLVWDSLGKLSKEYRYKNGQLLDRDYHNEGKDPIIPKEER